MTISLTVENTGSGTSPFTTPVTVTAGDGAIIVLSSYGNNVTVSSVTDNGGNTWVPATGAAISNATGSMDVWYCANPGSNATSMIITLSSAQHVQYQQYSANGQIALAQGGNVVSSGTPQNGPALSATGPSVAAIGTVFNSAAPTGAGGGYTFDGTQPGSAFAHIANAGTVSGQVGTFTGSGSGQNYNCTGAIFGAPAAPSSKGCIMASAY